MKLIKILFILMILMLVGCTGISRVSTTNSGDTLNTESRILNIPKLSKTAIIVPLFGEVSEKWSVNVEKVLQDSQYNLIVLWIESPGGGVTETILLTHKLKVLQKKYNKQIYVYSERILASGAYWVAAEFEKIIVSPAGYTGSIGVYMMRADFSGLYDMLGLKYHYIASDSTKVMGNPATPMEDWEHTYWQGIINEIHAIFMNHIWAHRSTQLINAYELRNSVRVKTVYDTLLVMHQFRAIASGILYDSKRALLAGLVDSVLFFDEFIEALQLDGFKVVTAKGKVIDTFYPFDNKKKKMRQEVWWDHLQVYKDTYSGDK